MRGLIGLFVVSVLVSGAVDVAVAGAPDETTCDSCRCVPKKILRVVTCCFPEVPAGMGPGGASPEPPEVSACWQEGQFDPDACSLLCEQLNEPAVFPPNCRPMPCGPGEQLVMVKVEETVGVAVRTVGPCDECPPVEAGQCNDGVNNDAWLDDLTDTQDPDCKAATPAASPYGMAALLVVLAGFGAYRLRKSRTVGLS